LVAKLDFRQLASFWLRYFCMQASAPNLILTAPPPVRHSLYDQA